MSPQDKIDKDGIRNDHVPYDPAASHLHIYADDRQQLATFQAPVLLHADNPHERLYVAALDGTGNDKVNDPNHKTNVGLISDQIEDLNRSGDHRINSGYVAGPGTQADAITRTFDGAIGSSADVRAEQMYKQLIDQAKEWRHDDPNVQIRVAATGFSRGADEVALFTRLVEERGIQDKAGAKYTLDPHGQITHVEYTKPPLVPPHQVAQAVALFDPVGTGHEMHEDRRLPPSVISGIQFIAKDEHRGLFKSDHIIDPGIAPDGRFAGVYVPGAHSDDGGGYNRDGLSIRTGNLAIDYLNGLSDKPFLAKQAESDDPRLNVIHHSEDSMLLYRLAPKIDRSQAGGYNELEVPKRQIGHVADPYNAEPRNETLSRQFQWQTAYPEPPQLAQPSPAATPSSLLDPSATLGTNTADGQVRAELDATRRASTDAGFSPVPLMQRTTETPAMAAARVQAARNGGDVDIQSALSPRLSEPQRAKVVEAPHLAEAKPFTTALPTGHQDAHSLSVAQSRGAEIIPAGVAAADTSSQAAAEAQRQHAQLTEQQVRQQATERQRQQQESQDRQAEQREAQAREQQTRQHEQERQQHQQQEHQAREQQETQRRETEHHQTQQRETETRHAEEQRQAEAKTAHDPASTHGTHAATSVPPGSGPTSPGANPAHAPATPPTAEAPTTAHPPPTPSSITASHDPLSPAAPSHDPTPPVAEALTPLPGQEMPTPPAPPPATHASTAQADAPSSMPPAATAKEAPSPAEQARERDHDHKGAKETSAPATHPSIEARPPEIDAQQAVGEPGKAKAPEAQQLSADAGMPPHAHQATNSEPQAPVAVAPAREPAPMPPTAETPSAVPTDASPATRPLEHSTPAPAVTPASLAETIPAETMPSVHSPAPVAPSRGMEPGRTMPGAETAPPASANTLRPEAATPAGPPSSSPTMDPALAFAWRPADAAERDAPAPNLTHASSIEPLPNATAAPDDLDARGRPLFNHPSHTDHALFQQAYAGVTQLDADLGRAPDDNSLRLAGMLTRKASDAGLQQIDQVKLSDDGERAFALQGKPGSSHTQFAWTYTDTALETPLTESSEPWDQFRAPDADVRLEQAPSLDEAAETGAPGRRGPFGNRKEDKAYNDLWFAMQSKNPLAIDQAMDAVASTPGAEADQTGRRLHPGPADRGHEKAGAPGAARHEPDDGAALGTS